MRCIRAAALCAVSCYLAACIPVLGQPLVTGDLSVYYDFDDFVDIVPDESGNELHGMVTFGQDGFDDDAHFDDLPDIRWSDDAVRGAGSAWFHTDAFIKEDRIQICQPYEPDDPQFCEDLDESLVPHEAFTVAAWVMIEETGQDHSVFQSRSLDSSFVTHAQVQGDGRLRIHLRGQFQAEDIVGTRVYTDGSEGNPNAAYPFDEWFHYAATYDQATNSYGLYYNGRRVAGGPANGDAGNIELGDWGQGAWIGLVPDWNRQLVGKMDEFYLFTRALSAVEIEELFVMEPSLLGDFNDDGILNETDINALAAEANTGGGNLAYDVTSDGQVNQQDCEHWVNVLKWTYVGDSNLDGEFNSADLVQVFVRGKYENEMPAGWDDGDWNFDQVFNSSDMVVAFIEGAYEIGVRPPGLAVAVPEPSALVLLILGALLGRLHGRRRPA